MKHKFFIISAIGLLFLIPQVPVYGLEIVVTDNGSGSSSEVSVQNEVTESISQTNESNISNDIQSEANTGDNEASGNSGETSIETGNVDTDVTINNDSNYSVVTDTCCEGSSCCTSDDTNITVSGNGENSINTVNAQNLHTTNVEIVNVQNVQNSVNGSANTGDNTTNGNNGNVSITTGSVTASEHITTTGNEAYVSILEPKNNVNILVKNNGANSINTTSFSDNTQTNVLVNNLGYVTNLNYWDLNTGRNTSNSNNGNVVMVTGSIAFKSDIFNKINTSIVEIKCCNNEINPPIEPPIEPPIDHPIEPPIKQKPPTDGGGSNGNGNNGNGSIGGIVAGTSTTAGAILPSTGSSWWLYATIANITMLLLGLYLRLKAGRSPAHI